MRCPLAERDALIPAFEGETVLAMRELGRSEMVLFRLMGKYGLAPPVQ